MDMELEKRFERLERVIIGDERLERLERKGLRIMKFILLVIALAAPVASRILCKRSALVFGSLLFHLDLLAAVGAVGTVGKTQFVFPRFP